jgi:hypothetical protein
MINISFLNVSFPCFVKKINHLTYKSNNMVTEACVLYKIRLHLMPWIYKILGGLTDFFKGLEHKICCKCYEMTQHKTSFCVVISKTIRLQRKVTVQALYFSLLFS